MQFKKRVGLTYTAYFIGYLVFFGSLLFFAEQLENEVKNGHIEEIENSVSTTKNFLIFTIVILSTIFLTDYLCLRQNDLKRLKLLTEGFDSLSKGNFNEQFDGAVLSEGDDWGYLAKSFNQITLSFNKKGVSK